MHIFDLDSAVAAQVHIKSSKMWLTPYPSVDALILLSTLFLVLYKYASRNFDHWKKKNVFYIEPIAFFGNFLDIFLFRTSIGEYLAKLYHQTKEPILGIFVFDSPHLIVRSPELIKAILVKDFHNFDDRNVANPKHEPLASSMLFVSKNPVWKAIRARLTPAFTSGKLKNMIPLINEVGESMKKFVLQKSPKSLEAKEICAKYSTDVIGKCAFAINAKCFENEDAEFRQIGRLMFDFRWSIAVQQTSHFFLPRLVSLFRMKFLDVKVIEFMRETFWNTIRLRKGGTHKANDLIDFLIEMMQDDDFREKNKFEGDMVVAQAAQFFAAGFETTSSTMAFTLYELCLHPPIQNKLREEIKTCIQEHGGVTYEAIQNMKYLHMCISETLRKYPPLPFLDRKTKSDYKLPGSDVVIEKGTPVFIPVFGLHYDEEYFPDSQKFDPERFSEENLSKIVPFTYVPFGEGPRNCIGERFGMMSAKLGLIHILSEFEVERSADTPVPIEFDPKGFLLTSSVGLPMKFSNLPSYNRQ